MYRKKVFAEIQNDNTDSIYNIKEKDISHKYTIPE